MYRASPSPSRPIQPRSERAHLCLMQPLKALLVRWVDGQTPLKAIQRVVKLRKACRSGQTRQQTNKQSTHISHSHINGHSHPASQLTEGHNTLFASATPR